MDICSGFLATEAGKDPLDDTLISTLLPTRSLDSIDFGRTSLPHSASAGRLGVAALVLYVISPLHKSGGLIGNMMDASLTH